MSNDNHNAMCEHFALSFSPKMFDIMKMLGFKDVGELVNHILNFNKVRTEKEVRDMLELIDRDEDLHTVIIKDVGIEEIKTTKDILHWFLKEKKT